MSGFTMVEIALSLAIIGFALVAIIGVLPAGLSVQKDNREQTVIDLDANFLMNAIRNGAQGQNDLTNYILGIVKTRTEIPLVGALPTGSGPTFFTQVFTNGDAALTNAADVLGFLSIPKYLRVTTANPLTIAYWSNSTVAYFRAINAPATDQGSSQASRDFAFEYQVTVEVIPSAESPYAAGNANWVNLTAPSLVTNAPPGGINDAVAQYLQPNLYEIRLTFRWPVFPNGKIGGKKMVFRSSVAGTCMGLGANGVATNNPDIPWFIYPQVYGTTQVKFP